VIKDDEVLIHAISVLSWARKVRSKESLVFLSIVVSVAEGIGAAIPNHDRIKPKKRFFVSRFSAIMTFHSG
jgi:hypothetical protein